VILVDSNIPMYLVGSPHPHKSDAQRLLEQLVADRQRLVTDAKVLQEILHRYVAIDRRTPSNRRSTLCSASSTKFSTLRGVPPSVPRRLSWDIDGCRRVMLSISPSWNSMESIES